MSKIILFILFILLLVIICKCKNENYKQVINNNKNITNNNKICCIYSYYEKNDLYKENLNYFLNIGIYDEIDYYIIINGDYTININELTNLKIFKRGNIGYDFGAYSYALKYIDKEYDYYCFINSSVRGPYLEYSCIKWYEPFIKLFNEDVKVVGTTINILNEDNTFGYDMKSIYNKSKPYSHVQSMFFMIDKEYLNYLNTKNFFDENKINNLPSFYDLIIHYEIGLSQIAINNNWNINCIIQPYRDQDYRKITNEFGSFVNDIYYTNKYFNKTINPYDVIFFKNNRF